MPLNASLHGKDSTTKVNSAIPLDVDDLANMLQDVKRLRHFVIIALDSGMSFLFACACMCCAHSLADLWRGFATRKDVHDIRPLDLSSEADVRTPILRMPCSFQSLTSSMYTALQAAALREVKDYRAGLKRSARDRSRKGAPGGAIVDITADTPTSLFNQYTAERHLEGTRLQHRQASSVHAMCREQRNKSATHPARRRQRKGKEQG